MPEDFYAIETTLALIQEVEKSLKVNALDENAPIDECDSHTLRKIATITANLSTILTRKNKDARLLQLFQKSEELKGFLETVLSAYAGNEKLKKWLLTLHSAKTSQQIDRELQKIITQLESWQGIVKQKYGDVGEGNEHLEDLPQPADQETFYVKVKELQPGVTLHFSQPINPVQMGRIQKERTSTLLKYNSKETQLSVQGLGEQYDTGKAPHH